MVIMDKIFSIKSPFEVAKELAERLRQQRLAHAWSREELAERSGVTTASIKRFELTGAISLHRLLALCFTLHAIDDFDRVLSPPTPSSIRELKKSLQTRQRGRRRPP
jgi:transcriptional regulator with XRE-family HTH domain